MSFTPAQFATRPLIKKGDTFGYSFQWIEDDSPLDLSVLSGISVKLFKSNATIFEHTLADGLTISTATGSPADSNDLLSGTASDTVMDIGTGAYYIEVVFTFADGTVSTYVSSAVTIIGDGQAGTPTDFVITITNSTGEASAQQSTTVLAQAIAAKDAAEGYAANLNRASIESGDALKIERIKSDESGWENISPKTILTAKPNWVHVSKYNDYADYDDLPEALESLPETGGVIFLDNIKKGETGYTSPTTISKPNVSIFGMTPPIIDFENDIIGNDCPIIEGKVSVSADNFHTQNTCYSTNSALLENDCLAFPNVHYGAKVYDCAFVGFSRSSPYHCLLIENQNNVDIRNVQCLKNVWGVTQKASNAVILGLRAKNNNNGPFVVKSDGVKTVENVICNGLYSESTADGSGDYYGILYVQNWEASSKLKNVTISNFILKEQYVYLSNVNTAGVEGLDNIKLSNGHIDLTNSVKDQYILAGSQPCDGLVQLSNVSGEGGGLYGINDANTAFSNLYLDKVIFDRPNLCRANLDNKGVGTTFQKANVVHNTPTPLFSYTYDSPSFASFDVNIGIQTVSCIGIAKFSVMNGFSQGNALQVHKQGFNLTDVVMSLSINTTTKVVSVSVTQTNVDSQTGTIYVSIVPRLVGGLTSITPL